MVDRNIHSVPQKCPTAAAKLSFLRKEVILQSHYT